MQNKKNKLRKLWLNLKNQITMDEIKNKIQLETINVNKKMQIKEDGRNWKKKSIEWLVWFSTWPACKSMNKEKEKEKKMKKSFWANRVESPYMRHLVRKRMPKWIKWCCRSASTTTRARRLKLAEWLTC